MRKEASVKQRYSILLHLSCPAGIEPLRSTETHSVCNVQPYYSAGDSATKENDQMIKKLALTVLVVLATLTLAACAPRVTTTSLSPEDGAAYAAEVDEIVENLLVGWSVCDHAMAMRDYEETWRAEASTDDSGFQHECDELIGVVGAYQSKTLDHVEDRPGIHARVVIYNVVFENDPDVTLEVYFGIDDPNHRIIGLSFDESTWK
jgi:hypothetical protein